MSRYLGDHRRRMKDAAAGLADRHFAPLERADSVELAGDVLVPFVSEVFAILFELDETLDFIPEAATRIFDHWASVKALREAEAAVAEMRRRLEPLFRRGVAREEEGLFLALTILGRDSLLSTLADSIAGIARANRGRTLSEIAYPPHPPATGVAIAERQATESFEYAGAAFRRGDWLRFYYQAIAQGDNPAKSTLMFGVGAHACLGRHLALDLWQAVAAKLGSIRRRAEIVDFAYGDNHVFAMPRTVRLELRP
jgi:hypothetical protein